MWYLSTPVSPLSSTAPPVHPGRAPRPTTAEDDDDLTQRYAMLYYSNTLTADQLQLTSKVSHTDHVRASAPARHPALSA